MRLGSYYRKKCFQSLFKKLKGATILDLGGYDGYFISDLDFQKKIVLDIILNKTYSAITYRKGSYLTLANNKEKYNTIFLFDVLQYIDDPKRLFQILSKHMTKGSLLFISVPHPQMVVFPKFVSVWLHKKWGNFVHIGYTSKEIKRLLPKELKIKEMYLVKEKYFRFLYFPLRFIWGAHKRSGQKMVNSILDLEKADFFGEYGHIYIKIVRN